MTVSLGKRKRPGAASTRAQEQNNQQSEESDGEEHIQDIFRKAFEAKFKPLPIFKTEQAEEDPEDDEDEESESDWPGFSETEETIPVFEHTDVSPEHSQELRKEARSFTSSKPPSTFSSNPTPQSPQNRPNTSDGEDSSQNLKNDLALQRLLSESHLLSSAPSEDLAPTGKIRHKALDLRLQAMGSKTSIFVQEKMPMSFRKGIEKKKMEREVKRRKDAKEAGIILEAVEKKKASTGRRERGIGAPGVGRFKGGLLTLSKRDISEIQSSGGRVGGRGDGRSRGTGNRSRRR